MKKKSASQSAFFRLRALIALLVCAAAACSILTVPLLAFFRSEAPPKVSQRTLTFEERVSYQRAIEEVYWRHRIWPKDRPDPKPSLDAVMSQAQLEKKVADYLRNSQALEVYWQRPITSEQLQAEMERMAQHTKQPEVLHELFEALGNDPFVIAECLARPVLAERLVTNSYAYDQRIHGELKQRAEAELQAHSTVAQMKDTSGKYSEVELIRSYSAQDAAGRRAEHGAEFNRQEWDGAVQKLAATFNKPNAASPKSFGVERADMPVRSGNAAAEAYDALPIGKLSSLQEDEGRYYATAVIEKTEDRLKVAIVAWQKEPLESWLATARGPLPTAITTPNASYILPEIQEGAACIDNTWTATAGPPDIRYDHTAVWTGSEMIIWGGGGSGNYPYWSFRNTGARYNPSTDTWTTTGTTHAPTGRVGHTAVWTGSEMIVWGGFDGLFHVTNTGGRYNPSTNSWTATSTISAPAPRELHAAVWTGSEMIVWGGTGADYLNTGGRYNPNTNRWSATSLTNAPAARYFPTAVWTGTEMIIWGGTDDLTVFNTGGKYNPSANSWIATSISNAPDGRESHTAVWSGSEMIVWGGTDVSGSQYFNTGGNYNPGTDSWIATSTTNAPTARSGSKAVWTGSEMIVWGGWGGVSYFNTGGRYNPGANSWTATITTNAPASRAGHTAVWTGSDMIVWGGGGDYGYLNDGGRYDPGANIWTNVNTYDVPDARGSHTAVWTGSEMIVWGGTAYPNWLNTGGRYDPTTDNWTATSGTNGPEGRALHSAVWTGSEMIVWGGQGDGGIAELNTGGRYNPTTNDWIDTTTTNAPTARQLHTAIWTGSEMIVWGGWDGFDDVNTGGRYDPLTDTWIVIDTSDAPIARDSHTAIWTDSEMIVWGGWNFDSQTNLNTGGRYDPATNSWAATETTNAPDGRSNHTAVWTGSEMIVWGGNLNFIVGLNTGGRYDPSTDSWVTTSLTNAPDARYDHTAVWTGNEMIVWGGGYFDPNNYVFVPFNTGGRYDPSTDNWRATNLTGAPDARDTHTAVWTGNEMIVWGGLGLGALNSGGRYCAQFGPPPTPTPTPRATPRPRSTPHVRPTPPQ
jgi:N-acetylneuraminic acid mutarotase